MTTERRIEIYELIKLEIKKQEKFTGMCYSCKLLCDKSKITLEEFKYLSSHFITLAEKGNWKGYYMFNPGDKESRYKWLNNRTKELKKKIK